MLHYLNTKGGIKINVSTVPRPYFSNHQNEYITIPQSQTNKKGESNYLTGLRRNSKILFLKCLPPRKLGFNLLKVILIQINLLKERNANAIILKSRIQIAIQLKFNIVLAYINLMINQAENIEEEYQKLILLWFKLYNTRAFEVRIIEFDEYDLFVLNIRNEIITQWFDNKEFPLTAQSQVSKAGDFDSDPSVHSEVMETETFTLNQLKQQFKQKKQKKQYK
ncbi:unnamed protein product (macronuclear) [Paramecium tetraurelia]|uniref:Uncharacterized protein n=1 Tax=Paramecium tetraurelia TaxID=5888 RepID=A0CE69_PARTE|nr:uncharacterized protein GSPATT00037522001 [Paramecium tetraurelia]CAK69086.1 unnamed protein product [Paramecium tetraurelia]|eukprot:XP_001436483.1 hypothetical protein (macronuclear) [Paramecium tetraurelia strain d4-2]